LVDEERRRRAGNRAARAEGTFCDFCEFLCDKKRKLKTNLNDYISREHTFFSGSSLHKGRVLGASEETDYKMAH
jgi:hypothetical protein